MLCCTCVVNDGENVISSVSTKTLEIQVRDAQALYSVTSMHHSCLEGYFVCFFFWAKMVLRAVT
jgi:hypothetical protein